MFNTFTGLLCPGCGVSRMFLALLRFDFAEAFSWNPVVFLSLPILAYLIGRIIYRYIVFDDSKINRFERVLTWTILICLLFFGIWRNL